MYNCTYRKGEARNLTNNLCEFFYVKANIEYIVYELL